ncbi:MAG: hypothetical protein KGJ11_04645, partial [Candidatus Omnitrophica bacterium]|nr:hypothetical protein [Candidatus Omnitrophota bacterium]
SSRTNSWMDKNAVKQHPKKFYRVTAPQPLSSNNSTLPVTMAMAGAVVLWKRRKILTAHAYPARGTDRGPTDHRIKSGEDDKGVPMGLATFVPTDLAERYRFAAQAHQQDLVRELREKFGAYGFTRLVYPAAGGDHMTVLSALRIWPNIEELHFIDPVLDEQSIRQWQDNLETQGGLWGLADVPEATFITGDYRANPPLGPTTGRTLFIDKTPGQKGCLRQDPQWVKALLRDARAGDAILSLNIISNPVLNIAGVQLGPLTLPHDYDHQQQWWLTRLPAAVEKNGYNGFKFRRGYNGPAVLPGVLDDKSRPWLLAQGSWGKVERTSGSSLTEEELAEINAQLTRQRQALLQDAVFRESQLCIVSPARTAAHFETRGRQVPRIALDTRTFINPDLLRIVLSHEFKDLYYQAKYPQIPMIVREMLSHLTVDVREFMALVTKDRRRARKLLEDYRQLADVNGMYRIYSLIYNNRYEGPLGLAGEVYYMLTREPLYFQSQREAMAKLSLSQVLAHEIFKKEIQAGSIRFNDQDQGEMGFTKDIPVTERPRKAFSWGRPWQEPEGRQMDLGLDIKSFTGFLLLMAASLSLTGCSSHHAAAAVADLAAGVMMAVAGTLFSMTVLLRPQSRFMKWLLTVSTTRWHDRFKMRLFEWISLGLPSIKKHLQINIVLPGSASLRANHAVSLPPDVAMKTLAMKESQENILRIQQKGWALNNFTGVLHPQNPQMQRGLESATAGDLQGEGNQYMPGTAEAPVVLTFDGKKIWQRLPLNGRSELAPGSVVYAVWHHPKDPNQYMEGVLSLQDDSRNKVIPRVHEGSWEILTAHDHQDYVRLRPNLLAVVPVTDVYHRQRQAVGAFQGSHGVFLLGPGLDRREALERMTRGLVLAGILGESGKLIVSSRRQSDNTDISTIQEAALACAGTVRQKEIFTIGRNGDTISGNGAGPIKGLWVWFNNPHARKIYFEGKRIDSLRICLFGFPGEPLAHLVSGAYSQFSVTGLIGLSDADGSFSELAATQAGRLSSGLCQVLAQRPIPLKPEGLINLLERYKQAVDYYASQGGRLGDALKQADAVIAGGKQGSFSRDYAEKFAGYIVVESSPGAITAEARDHLLAKGIFVLGNSVVEIGPSLAAKTGYISAKKGTAAPPEMLLQDRMFFEMMVRLMNDLEAAARKFDKTPTEFGQAYQDIVLQGEESFNKTITQLSGASVAALRSLALVKGDAPLWNNRTYEALLALRRWDVLDQSMQTLAAVRQRIKILVGEQREGIVFVDLAAAREDEAKIEKRIPEEKKDYEKDLNGLPPSLRSGFETFLAGIKGTPELRVLKRLAYNIFIVNLPFNLAFHFAVYDEAYRGRLLSYRSQDQWMELLMRCSQETKPLDTINAIFALSHLELPPAIRGEIVSMMDQMFSLSLRADPVSKSLSTSALKTLSVSQAIVVTNKERTERLLNAVCMMALERMNITSAGDTLLNQMANYSQMDVTVQKWFEFALSQYSPPWRELYDEAYEKIERWRGYFRMQGWLDDEGFHPEKAAHGSKIQSDFVTAAGDFRSCAVLSEMWARTLEEHAGTPECPERTRKHLLESAQALKRQKQRHYEFAARLADASRLEGTVLAMFRPKEAWPLWMKAGDMRQARLALSSMISWREAGKRCAKQEVPDGQAPCLVNLAQYVTRPNVLTHTFMGIFMTNSLTQNHQTDMAEVYDTSFDLGSTLSRYVNEHREFMEGVITR